MKSYLEIGKIVTLHGLRGDVKVQPWCDDAEFLCEFPVLYLGKEKKEVEVSHARPQKNMVLLHLEGYDTPEQAETLRNQILFLIIHYGTIQVAVYDNRLEITSPGKLPMGQTFISDVP